MTALPRSTAAVAARLPDGRLHLQHGPIDLIVEAFGATGACETAYARAVRRFAPVLDALVAELPGLRRPADVADPAFAGPVARRMAAAVRPHRGFVTPMAAVAGAVADEVLQALVAGPGLSRAYVNNGGDIALWLAQGQSLSAAIAGGAGGQLTVRHAHTVRGIATSGWRGRSHSLGIADAVTVAAPTAAAADVAATLVANAVDLPGHPAIARRPARELDPESDLGERPVTVAVGPLSAGEGGQALDRGLAVAEAMRDAGLIAAAALFLAGQSRVLAPPSA